MFKKIIYDMINDNANPWYGKLAVVVGCAVGVCKVGGDALLKSPAFMFNCAAGVVATMGAIIASENETTTSELVELTAEVVSVICVAGTISGDALLKSPVFTMRAILACEHYAAATSELVGELVAGHTGFVA